MKVVSTLQNCFSSTRGIVLFLLTLLMALTLSHLETDAQNVGIGTNTPEKKLDIRGNAIDSDSLGVGVTDVQAPVHFVGLAGVPQVMTLTGSTETYAPATPINELSISGLPDNILSASLTINLRGSFKNFNETADLYIDGDPIATGVYDNVLPAGDCMYFVALDAVDVSTEVVNKRLLSSAMS